MLIGIKKLANELKDDSMNLSDYQSLDLAVKIRSLEILSEAFTVAGNPLSKINPLEKIAIELADINHNLCQIESKI